MRYTKSTELRASQRWSPHCRGWVLLGSSTAALWSILVKSRNRCQGYIHFLINKWHFDELYDYMFMRPMHIVGSWCAAFDRKFLDGTLHGLASGTVKISEWDRIFDETIIDGMVNLIGTVTGKVGESFRVLQTGKLRQYVMFIAVGVLALFMLLFAVFPK